MWLLVVASGLKHFMWLAALPAMFYTFGWSEHAP
jgi:hypothetical protein